MLLASWFGAGLLPYAPGTWGAFAALPCGWAVAWFGGPVALTGGAAIVFAVGCFVSGTAAQALGQKDPGWIVIDEVAAIWAVLGPLDFWVGPLDWRAYGAAFVFFRIFDILKPWPARLIERRDPGRSRHHARRPRRIGLRFAASGAAHQRGDHRCSTLKP